MIEGKNRRGSGREEEDAAHVSVLGSCAELSRPLNPRKSHKLKRKRNLSRLKLKNELVKTELLTSTQVIILIELR